MKRRTFLKTATLASLSPSLSFASDKRKAFEVEIAEFMKAHSVPGISVAFASKGRPLARGAYGIAHPETGEKLHTSHRLCIANISKPITAVAIFQLLEQEKLSLEDQVFGPEGILNMEGPRGITVFHLLTHTAGGWPNDEKDPMFRKKTLSAHQLIPWVLETYPLTHAPGANYAYSNFGYCLLGRVIERVTGQAYAGYIQREIFDPCGMKGMYLGTFRPRKGEVAYVDEQGKLVPHTLNIARMDAHGGWVGTPTDLIRFALHLDELSPPKDLLTAESLQKMTTPWKPGEQYACGWSVNEHGNRWHMGSLPGLTSLLVQTKSGKSWAACVNTRTEGIKPALDELMWRLSQLI